MSDSICAHCYGTYGAGHICDPAVRKRCLKPSCVALAARVETLTAELAECRKAFGIGHDTLMAMQERAEAAEARVAALTTALQQVVTAPLQVDCIRIARAALAAADRPEGTTPPETGFAGTPPHLQPNGGSCTCSVVLRDGYRASRDSLPLPNPQDDAMTPDELRALADAATPGPWLIAYADGSGERDITTAESRVDYSVPNVVNGGEDDCGIPHGVLRPEDARLISLAPSLARDHAALLDWAARAAEALENPWETVWRVDKGRTGAWRAADDPAECRKAFGIGHDTLMAMQERAEAAEARVETLENALAPFLSYPRVLTIGAHTDIEVRVSKKQYDIARAALASRPDGETQG